MTKTTVGREPVQIVEMVQPFCANSFGCKACTAGLGTVDTSDLSVNFANGVGDYVGENATVTAITGGVNVAATSNDPQLEALSVTTGFDGDNFRYVVVCGKLNWTPSTHEWKMFYANAGIVVTGSRSMTALNKSTAFRGVTLESLKSGDEFVAVFDAADSTDYATQWQGKTVNELRFDLASDSNADFDVYSITVCDTSLIASEGSECFNTRGTCQDVNNFALKDGGLPLYFSRGNVADREVNGADYIIPSLGSVSTSPTRINLASSDTNATGLGNRAVLNLTFTDHPHSDAVVDPYVKGRSYDPLARSSFWSKWMRRNKFRYNMTVRVYEGYEGEALASMVKRRYIVTGASGPDESGSMKFQAKDILAKVEERKAQAPEASPGLLAMDVTADTLTIPVFGAVQADYPSSGTLRINDELLTYSSVADSSNGVTFTVSARGTDGTISSSHSEDDGVQRCVRYTDEPVQDIVEDLLTTWGGVDAALVDSATTFADEGDRHLNPYILSAVISEPVSVSKLLSELQEQCGFYIWWDERAALVKMKAIRGIDAELPTVTDSNHILAGSFSITDLPRSRISQVWFSYDLRDEAASIKDLVNFKQVRVVADLASETDEQYGEKSIRKINSRWIDTSSLAFSTAFKIVSRYSAVPRHAKFRMDAKDRDYWVGDQVKISHFLDVDEFGERNVANWTIISAEEVVPGEVVEYTAEDTTLYGKIYEWQANSAADYPGAATAAFSAAYWGDSDGLLSDGAPCARWG